MATLVERLQEDGATLALEAAAALESDAKVIAALREALEPFAEVARWANRNRHDLAKDFDMILRGPGPTIAGHLQVQSRDFIAALATIEQTAGENT